MPDEETDELSGEGKEPETMAKNKTAKVKDAAPAVATEHCEHCEKEAVPDPKGMFACARCKTKKLTS